MKFSIKSFGGLALSLTLINASSVLAQDAVVSGGSLRVATYEPLCLDQIEGASRNTQTAMQDVYDRLVFKDQQGQIFAWIAEDWQISEDGLTYRFTIRDGVHFHDGTPLDAEAVRLNLQRWIDKRNAGGIPVSSITAENRVVTITLAAAYGPLLDELSEPVLGFVSPASITAFPPEARCEGGAGITIGSGPFVVASRVQGQELILKRNADYAWPPANAAHHGPAHLDGVEMRFLTEDSVRVGAVESGQADIATGVPAIAISGIEANPDLQLLRSQQPGIPWSFWLNQSKAPLEDQRVREALRIGVDYPALVSVVFFGAATPAYAAVTPGIPAAYAADQLGRWSFDPVSARALLDAAGWSEIGSDGIRRRNGVRLVVNDVSATNWNNQQRELLAQGIQASLANIGVEYNRHVLDFASADARFKANDYDIVDTSQASGNAPQLIFGAFHSQQTWANGNTNWGYVNDPALDSMLERAVGSADPAILVEALKAAQVLLNDKAYLLPIANPQVLVAARSSVNGLGFSSSGQIGSFYDVWLSR